MKHLLMVLIVFWGSVPIYSQDISEETRKKIYAVYSETAKPHLQAMKPVASDVNDPDQIQYQIARSLMIDTKFKYALSSFEKNITQKDSRNISVFVQKLNQTIKEEFNFPSGLNLPDQFFTDAQAEMEKAGLIIPK